MTITDRVYVKNARRLSSQMDRNMPRNIFHGAALDILYNTDEIENLDSATRDQLIDFVTDFLDCDCDDAPYCGCAERKFIRHVIDLRRQGMSPSRIVESLEAEYGLYDGTFARSRRGNRRHARRARDTRRGKASARRRSWYEVSLIPASTKASTGTDSQGYDEK
jgi:hypothetical protein